MSDAPLRTERIDAVEVLTLTDSARLNPLTAALQQSLLSELKRIRNDRNVRAVVVTGEGRGFCVGADLSTMVAPSDNASTVGERTARLMTEASNPLILALHGLPVPVVIAANGACAGAGVAIALSGDVTLMARSSYFYLPFAPRLGLIPDLGVTWLLQRSQGRARSLALSLLDERLAADQAVEWGLAWACLDDEVLRSEAVGLAHRLAELPTHAVLEVRKAFDHAASSTLTAQLQYETSRQKELIDLPSFSEGVKAFLEKRAPRFAPRSAVAGKSS